MGPVRLGGAAGDAVDAALDAALVDDTAEAPSPMLQP